MLSIKAQYVNKPHIADINLIITFAVTYTLSEFETHKNSTGCPWGIFSWSVNLQSGAGDQI